MGYSGFLFESKAWKLVPVAHNSCGVGQGLATCVADSERKVQLPVCAFVALQSHRARGCIPCDTSPWESELRGRLTLTSRPGLTK